jgi:hypothetical protein
MYRNLFWKSYLSASDQLVEAGWGRQRTYYNVARVKAHVCSPEAGRAQPVTALFAHRFSV